MQACMGKRLLSMMYEKAACSLRPDTQSTAQTSQQQGPNLSQICTRLGKRPQGALWEKANHLFCYQIAPCLTAMVGYESK